MGSGWGFAEDSTTHLNVALYDKDDRLLANMPFHAGDDVFEAFKSKYRNAKLSRFSFRINGYDLKSGLSLRFIDKGGDVFWNIPLDGSASCGGADRSFHYCIDSLTSESSPNKIYDRFVDRANHIIGFYQKLIPLLSLLGVLVYLSATIVLIKEVRKKQVLKTLSVWLILTGLATTFLLFIFSMCLITATSFNALIYLYTAPAYIMLLIFCSVSVSWGGSQIAFLINEWCTSKRAG